ncbi:MAG: hypothetical protein WCD66_02355 [Rhodanobacteraceae bacterium]
MKPHSTLLAAGMLALLFGVTVARAADDSLSSFPHKSVPVLVKVDSHGKVTQISPAIELSPRYRSLIRQSIQEMITGPATYHGRVIPSQLVMFLAAESRTREDGRYDVRFTSVKNQPVPAGSWFWLHDNGHRLALVSDSDRQDGHSRNSRMLHGLHSRPSYPNQSTTKNARASMHASPSRSDARASPGRTRFSHRVQR